MNTRSNLKATLCTLAAILLSIIAATTATKADAPFNHLSTLTAVDGANGDNYGWAVAADGDTIAVGAYNKVTKDAATKGVVYIYLRSGAGFLLQQKITGSDLNANNFGRSVALQGNTLIVGSDQDDGGRGAAYVFVRNGANWIYQARLIATDRQANDWFGGAVSLSNDTAVIGAAADATNIVGNHGSAYVFVRAGAIWTQQAKLMANDRADADFFGNAVSISGDSVVVGAPGKTVNGKAQQGAAYVFLRTGQIWAQQQKLSDAAGTAMDWYGTSVAILDNTLVIGASHNGNKFLGTHYGSAYVFQRTGVIWNQQTKLVAQDANGNWDTYFGSAVSLNPNQIVVGAQAAESGNQQHNGAVYVFTPSGASWSQSQKLTANAGQPIEALGHSVASTPQMIVAGAPYRTNMRGAAEVFVKSALAPSIKALSSQRTAASASELVNVAIVSDEEDQADALQVTIDEHAHATINGVSLSLQPPAADGTVRAMVSTARDARTAEFPLRVTNSKGKTAVTTLVIHVPPNTPPVLSYNSQYAMAIGGSINILPTAGPSDNGSIASIVVQSVNPALFTPVLVSPSGVVSISNPQVSGLHVVTIRATDNGGLYTDATFTLTVTGNCPPVNITPPTLPAGRVGQAYNQMLTVSGGSGPYSYGLSWGNLPNGMQLTASGALVGTPTQAGNFTFQVHALSSAGCHVIHTYMLTVRLLTTPIDLGRRVGT